jgi:hypothetical protein
MATIRELERGVWLEDSVPSEIRHDVETLCHLLSTCVADLVVTLSMFEQAQLSDHARFRESADRHRENWERDAERTREIEAALETAAGVIWGHPDYWERSSEIREQARRQMLREQWAHEDGPESYQRRVVFIHARSFVTTLAVLQRSLLAIRKYPFEPSVQNAIQGACDNFASAVPGLKGVRDSVAHVEERVRGEARGEKITAAPIINKMIHAPDGGVIVTESLNNQHFGGTIEDGTYAEVEVADTTTEIARSAVQAVFDALPWRAGHHLHEPSS